MKNRFEIRRINFEKIMNECGSRTSLAKRLGVSVSEVTNYLLKNNPRDISDVKAIEYEEALGLPAGFLDKTDDITNHDFDVTSFRVPEYNVQLSAGRGAEVINPENIKAHHILNDSFLTEYRVKKENLAIVSVVGHSMNPILIDGTKVVIDISRCEPIDNKVFAITTKNHTWVKRCRITPGGTIWQSDNEEYRQYDDDLNNGKSSVVIEGYVLYNLGQKVN